MDIKEPGNKVAIVTGGSRGIGRRIAERLAENHFTVIINYRNEVAKAEEVVAGIVKAGGIAIAQRADVNDEHEVALLFESVHQEYGRLDVVVHAAATLVVKPLADFTAVEIDAVLQTNLRGAILVNRQAAATVREGGAIINLSSAVTKNFAAGDSVYTATKAGVEALTKVLSREPGSRNITVNAVAPGRPKRKCSVPTWLTVETANK